MGSAIGLFDHTSSPRVICELLPVGGVAAFDVEVAAARVISRPGRCAHAQAAAERAVEAEAV